MYIAHTAKAPDWAPADQQGHTQQAAHKHKPAQKLAQVYIK